jgi:2-phospho-L-lactate guanylyltransferase
MQVCKYASGKWQVASGKWQVASGGQPKVAWQVTQSSSLIPQSSIWAIVPVKPLHDSKRRLAHILPAEERAELIHRFLIQTLMVLNQSGIIDRILVVSGDERVLATAQMVGAAVLVETAVLGLNPAVTTAVQFAADSGATAVLILPADLPFIEPADVAIMVGGKWNGRNPVPRLTICSDEQGDGSNALFISSPVPFTFRYGPGSFRQHLQEAHLRGLTTQIIHNPNLQFDLDTEADWHKYQLTINHSPLPINHS